MTKFRIHVCVPSLVADHWVGEVEAESKEAAQAKIAALYGELPLSADSEDNTDEVKYVDAWQVGIDSDGLEFLD